MVSDPRFPTWEQFSNSTQAAFDGYNRALASRSQSEKASWIACLQRCIAIDITDGRFSKEQGIAFLESRRAYGPKGKEALKCV